MTAPGPPALISVIKLSSREERQPALSPAHRYEKKKRGCKTYPRPKPVQEMVVVEAKPIKLQTVKCRLSSCSWPLLRVSGGITHNSSFDVASSKETYICFRRSWSASCVSTETVLVAAGALDSAASFESAIAETSERSSDTMKCGRVRARETRGDRERASALMR